MINNPSSRIAVLGFWAILLVFFLGGNATAQTTGTISGRITASDGTTPIIGVTVKALQGTTTVGTTLTNGTGDYSLTPLNTGTYTINASATGYGNKSQSSVVVTGGATTTINLSLDAIVSGPVTYIYDLLGRLKATVSPVDTVACALPLIAEFPQ